MAQERAAQAEALTAAAAAEFAALLGAAISKAAAQAPQSDVLKVNFLSALNSLNPVHRIANILRKRFAH